MKKIIYAFLFCNLVAFSSIQAQDKAPSPSATLIQKVGLTDVTIEYSRPGMKDRNVFAADGLVPFGKKWRTGANSATKITFSDAVEIGGKELASGSYAILTSPNKGSWDIHFFPYEATRWTGYADASPMLTIKATSKQMNHAIESFLITVDHLRDNSANIIMMWDKTMVSFPIGVK